MMIYLIILTIITVIVLIGLLMLLFLTIKKSKNNNLSLEKIAKEISDSISNDIKNNQEKLILQQTNNFLESNQNTNYKNRLEIDKNIKTLNEDLNLKIKELTQEVDNKLQLVNNNYKEISEKINKEVRAINENLNIKIDKIKESMDQKVENIKISIDEKLKSELSKRMQEHFDNVQNKMQDLSKNLTKFETVQTSVNDLKRVFNNVKTIGNIGEINLKKTLEAVLPSELWEENHYIQVDKDKNSNTNVEFAIHMPGPEGKVLPIDSKFPYKKFNDYVEANDEKSRKDAIKEIKSFIKQQAKKIKKYINQEQTTNIALMYLPVETLYGIVCEDEDLITEIQKNNIFISSPSTIISYIQAIYNIHSINNLEFQINDIFKSINVIQNQYGKLVAALDDSYEQTAKALKSIDKAQKGIGKINKEIEVIKIHHEFKPLNDFKKNSKRSNQIKKEIINIDNNDFQETIINEYEEE
ncbi:DNA recombination protein RmuC [Mycoplasmopsis lipofaciens]|uniref:DNA recombination protein RmuC n=1 Tax=Mycoplasmopsis lipofaciens TaxID=114884 RepID=UPI0004882713|nr:DNA recombination protein RmuC [Mycoplasmopsis lipofaciens]